MLDSDVPWVTVSRWRPLEGSGGWGKTRDHGVQSLNRPKSSFMVPQQWFSGVGVWTFDYIMGVAIVRNLLITDYTLNFNEIDDGAHLLSTCASHWTKCWIH